MLLVKGLPVMTLTVRPFRTSAVLRTQMLGPMPMPASIVALLLPVVLGVGLGNGGPPGPMLMGGGLIVAEVVAVLLLLLLMPMTFSLP